MMNEKPSKNLASTKLCFLGEVWVGQAQSRVFGGF
jgi:hypothetical protein